MMALTQLTRLRELSEKLGYDERMLSRFFECSPDLLGVMNCDGYLEKIRKNSRVDKKTGLGKVMMILMML